MHPCGQSSIVIQRFARTRITGGPRATNPIATDAATGVLFRTATEWVALLADAQRLGRLDTELDRLQRIPLLIVDEVGYR